MKILLTTGIACGALLVLAQAMQPIPTHYSQIDFPAWSYQPPNPKDYRVELKDGVIAYLVPDSTLDLVQLSLFCDHPNVPRKPSDVAAMDLYSDMLKSGGTVQLTPDRLEDSLEFIAASMSADWGDYQDEASFDALGKDADAMLHLLPQVALQPRLDPQVFKLRQRDVLEDLKHRYATPHGVMSIAYERVMQGDHPLNWKADEKEVAALTPAALKPMAGLGFTRKGMVLAVAGRFDRAEMIRRLNAFVTTFPEGGKESPVPPFKGALPPGVYLVDKPFSQATIRIGAPGVERPNPDYYPLVVASYILGDGGFTSRLMKRVRIDEGLAYDIGSEIESDYHRRGTVYAALQTKAPTGAYAVKLVFEEMRRMAAQGITDDELAKAKDGLLKSLPSLFDTPSNTARIFAQGEIWRRNPDHFIEYEKVIQAMTRQQVEAAFRKYFNPDSMRIIVVGPKNILLPRDETHKVSLSDFGKVTELTPAELDQRE